MEARHDLSERYGDLPTVLKRKQRRLPVLETASGLSNGLRDHNFLVSEGLIPFAEQ
ncbi:hypothetical protein ACFPRL_28960 [Pseudoclavibacter helvolus]